MVRKKTEVREWICKRLEQVTADLLKSLLQGVIQDLMRAEANAVHFRRLLIFIVAAAFPGLKQSGFLNTFRPYSGMIYAAFPATGGGLL